MKRREVTNIRRRCTVHRTTGSRTVALAALCLALAVQAMGQESAAREAFKGSRDLRERTAKTAASIEKYAKQLENTDEALERLNDSDRNLSSHYKRFASELRSLEKSQNKAGSEIEKLKSIGTTYFTAWDKANIAISDPVLREASAKRRSEVMEQYRSIADRLSETAFKLPELMTRLRDLNVFLGADLTPENVRRAEATIQTCRTEVREMMPGINELHKMLKDLAADEPR